MKKLLALLTITAMLMITATSANAQTKFWNRNFDERIASKIVTTDSTLTYVDSAVVLRNEVGIIEVTVIGYAKDTAYAITGKIQARYNKRRGTLTLGTVTEAIPVTRDTPLETAGAGGAAFTLVAVNNNVYVRVKGKAANEITWMTYLKRKSVSTVVEP